MRRNGERRLLEEIVRRGVPAAVMACTLVGAGVLGDEKVGRPRSASAVSVETLLERVEAENRELASQAAGAGIDLERIERRTSNDYTAPTDADFFRRMRGCGVVVIVAQSRERRELPLKRLYIDIGAGTVDLTRLGFKVWTVPPAAGIGGFQRNRSVEVYLLPASIVESGGQLLADFQTGRKGFGVSELKALKTAGMPNVSSAEPPSGRVILDYMDYEYPGLGALVGLRK
jgi:hypothetical protein